MVCLGDWMAYIRMTGQEGWPSPEAVPRPRSLVVALRSVLDSAETTHCKTCFQGTAVVVVFTGHAHRRVLSVHFILGQYRSVAS